MQRAALRAAAGGGLRVWAYAALQDNYGFLAHCGATGCTAAVDTPDADRLFAELDRRELRLTHVLNTHHHADHVGGNLEVLQRVPDVEILAPSEPNGAVPGVTRTVGPGDVVRVGAQEAVVMDVAGHTQGQVAFHFAGALFPGDAIFPMGCGRLFEGSAEQAFAALQRIAALPDATQVYSAHEYALDNARFALAMDPHSEAVRAQAHEFERLRAAGEPTVPTTVGREKATNPFLTLPRGRLDPRFADAAPVEVFAELRRIKDSFDPRMWPVDE